MQGLDYLHYNKALHGDLKPANLLLSSEQLVKIADFGSAMIYRESEGTWEGPVNGTPAFRPPETLTASGRLTRKVSVAHPRHHADLSALCHKPWQCCIVTCDRAAVRITHAMHVMHMLNW